MRVTQVECKACGATAKQKQDPRAGELCAESRDRCPAQTWLPGRTMDGDNRGHIPIWLRGPLLLLWTKIPQSRSTYHMVGRSPHALPHFVGESTTAPPG